MRYSGGKFRLRSVFEINRPDVPQPVALAVATTLCVLPLVALLAFDIIQRIGPYSAPMFSPTEVILLVVFCGVVPMLTAHSIATNRPSSRWLLIALVAGLLGLGVLWLHPRAASRVEAVSTMAIACALLVLVYWWLFRSARMRVYYALASGRPVPQDLADSELSTADGDRILGALRAVGPFLEILVVIVIIAAVVYGFIVVG